MVCQSISAETIILACISMLFGSQYTTKVTNACAYTLCGHQYQMIRRKMWRPSAVDRRARKNGTEPGIVAPEELKETMQTKHIGISADLQTCST